MKSMRIRLINLFAFVLVLSFGCSKGIEAPEAIGYEVPVGFPEVEDPEDNEFSALRLEFGRKLFFDKRLSKDGQVSCASCHKPEFAFADNRATSPGAFNRPGTKNSPSLANVAYHPYFMREGGVPTLEMQVLVPIQEHNEFAHNIVDICNSLREDSLYDYLSDRAYRRDFDPFVLTRALAVFERSLISGESRYDVYLQGGAGALSSQEKMGMNLFFSDKTNCSSCHSGLFLSDFDFRNNGLDTNLSDIGRERLTGNPSDRYHYKTPSLRNAELTAPYMHNGQFQSLMEVLEHYNSGGISTKYSDSLLRPLGLSQSELEALVAFLEALTDNQFIDKSILLAP